MDKRRIGLIMLAACICVGRASEVRGQQNKTHHEIYLSGSGGVSAMTFSGAEGLKNGKPLGGGFGMGYSCFFNGHVSLSTGADFQFMNGKVKAPRLADDWGMLSDNDTPPYDFDFSYEMRDYSETERLQMVTVPLMVRLYFGPMYVGLGGKIGFPLKGSYTSEASKLVTEGDYPVSNPAIDKQEPWGFGTYSVSGSGALTFGTSYTASIEAGLRWRMSGNVYMMFGVYVDYGLNNMLKKPIESTSLIAAATKTGLPGYELSDKRWPHYYTLNSVLLSSSGTPKADNAGAERKPYVSGTVSSLSVGMTLKIAFRLDRSKGGGRAVAAIGASKKTATRTVEAPKPAAHAAPSRIASAGNVGTSHVPLSNREVGSNKPVHQDDLGRTLISRILASEPEKKPASEPKPIVKDAAPATVAQTAAEAGPQPVRQQMQPTARQRAAFAVPIYGFSVSTSKLSAAAKADLDRKVAFLKKYTNLTVTIEGHTDDSGNHKANVWVGQQRAMAARNYLVSHGIDGIRISVRSMAEYQPIAPNDTQENRDKNRRVTFMIDQLQ